MFSHRSFLALDGNSTDIVSLTKGGLEISTCTFSFIQDVDDNGKATTKVYGGVIDVTISQLPPQNIVDWALDSRKYQSGVIVSLDSENLPLEKIYFENAACVDFEIEYSYLGSGYASTRFLIQAEKLTVGNGIDFNNEWTL